MSKCNEVAFSCSAFWTIMKIWCHCVKMQHFQQVVKEHHFEAHLITQICKSHANFWRSGIFKLARLHRYENPMLICNDAAFSWIEACTNTKIPCQIVKKQVEQIGKSHSIVCIFVQTVAHENDAKNSGIRIVSLHIAWMFKCSSTNSQIPGVKQLCEHQ